MLGNPLHRSILAASILFFFDAFVLGQGAIAVFAILVLVVWSFPRAVYAAARGNRPLLLQRLRSIGVYVLMVVGIIAAVYLNRVVAARRAEVVVSACREYRATHRRLPDRLEDLVPDFLPSVPRARFSLMFSEFQYITSGNRHLLVYVAMPPFGRRVYNFEENRWSSLD